MRDGGFFILSFYVSRLEFAALRKKTNKNGDWHTTQSLTFQSGLSNKKKRKILSNLCNSKKPSNTTSSFDVNSFESPARQRKSTRTRFSDHVLWKLIENSTQSVLDLEIKSPLTARLWSWTQVKMDKQFQYLLSFMTSQTNFLELDGFLCGNLFWEEKFGENLRFDRNVPILGS